MGQFCSRHMHRIQIYMYRLQGSIQSSRSQSQLCFQLWSWLLLWAKCKYCSPPLLWPPMLQLLHQCSQVMHCPLQQNLIINYGLCCCITVGWLPLFTATSITSKCKEPPRFQLWASIIICSNAHGNHSLALFSIIAKEAISSMIAITLTR